MLTIAGLTVRFSGHNGGLLALDDIALHVREGEFVCLVGPSGCGKTTLLNVVAGLERPSAGAVTLDGRPVVAPSPDRVVVFQEYALYPWLTVVQNIAFGLSSQPLTRRERRERVDYYLHLVHLQGFAAAYPHQLSGGMQQRVALARALVMRPRVLLMDEPFAALDAQTRNLMQQELERLWLAEGNTVLFVTHSVDEAMYLADRVVVLSARPGRILADVTVPLARPRRRTSSEVNAVRERILEVLAPQVATDLA
ncbi:MAG: ABC transporter ATP-binding protein [Chloroflexi bacterium]|nr:ABC transporter ATP-binding protein [Chloroflexota bacterium]